MTMRKRIFSKLMLSVLFAATLFTFTACGDDDDDTPKVEDKFTTEYTFTAEFSADLVKTADVKAYVLSPDGTLTEETITKEKNSWTFKGSSIPDKAGVMFEFDAKSDIPEGNYKVGYQTTTTVTCLNNGDVFSYKSENSQHSFTVPSNRLVDFYGTSLTLAGEVDSNGEARVTDGSNIDFGFNFIVPRPIFGEGGRL